MLLNVKVPSNQLDFKSIFLVKAVHDPVSDSFEINESVRIVKERFDHLVFRFNGRVVDTLSLITDEGIQDLLTPVDEHIIELSIFRNVGISET